MTSGFQVATGVALIFIMFGMGMSLVPADFKKVNSPKVLSLGLFNQLIILPVMAFVLLLIFPVSPEIAIGIMIIAACPGGATSNLIANIAKANTALSICLTVISSLVTIITIPFVVNFALDYFSANGQQGGFRLDPVETIMKIFLSIVLPVAVGMFIRSLFPNFSNKMKQPVKIASILFITVLIIGIAYNKRDILLSSFVEVGSMVLLLNVSIMLVAYYSVAWLVGSGRDALTVAIESGIQNGILAIFIAVNLLENSTYAIAPMVYSIVMFLTIFAYIGFLKKRLGVASS